MKVCLAALLIFLPAAIAQTHAQALAVLRHAQQAAGGVERLQSIRDITREVEMLESDSGSKARQTVEIVLPNAIRLTNVVDDARILAFFDGITGWTDSPWASDDSLPAWQGDAAAQELLRQLESLLLSDRDDGKTVEYVKSTKIAGRTADLLDISGAGGGKVRLAIDALSGDVLTLEYPRIGPRGPIATVTDFYSDYRRLPNGLRMPFKIRTLSDGQPYMESQVIRLEYNRGLRAGVLGRRDPQAIQ